QVHTITVQDLRVVRIACEGLLEEVQRLQKLSILRSAGCKHPIAPGVIGSERDGLSCCPFSARHSVPGSKARRSGIPYPTGREVRIARDHLFQQLIRLRAAGTHGGATAEIKVIGLLIGGPERGEILAL